MIGPIQLTCVVLLGLFCFIMGAWGTVSSLGKYEYQMTIGCMTMFAIGAAILYKWTHGGF